MTKETEWLDEPNKLEWEHEGYQCTIIRNSKYGYLCGYVELQGDHPWHGRNVYSFYDIDVHGGITFSNDYLPIVTKNPYKQYCNLWWLGFDASHYDEDIYPWGYKYDSIITTATYKNIEFMKAECEKLVRQCQFRKEKQQKKVAVSVSQIEAQINQDKDMLKNLMLQIIDHGYAALDTYNRGSGGGVRPRYDNLELIQATNMLIDMVKWGKFNTAEKEAKDKNGAEKKPYTCECKYDYSNYGPGLIIGVCENKDPENIRLCKLATKIWDKTSIINTELRAIVFKTLAEEANGR